MCAHVCKVTPLTCFLPLLGKNRWDPHGGVFAMQLNAAIRLVQLHVRVVAQHQEKEKLMHEI